MSDMSSPWETFRVTLTPDDPHWLDCEPDLYVPELLDLTVDSIASLAVRHVFIDFDGTMAVNGNLPEVAEPVIEHLSAISQDSRFETFGIATNNRASYMTSIAARIGPHVQLYQPRETPKGEIRKGHPGYYRRILFETDIWDTPELAVMIGDSKYYDIAPAQELGIKTILVDRMEKRMAAHLQQRLAELKAQRSKEG